MFCLCLGLFVCVFVRYICIYIYIYIYKVLLMYFKGVFIEALTLILFSKAPINKKPTSGL